MSLIARPRVKVEIRFRMSRERQEGGKFKKSEAHYCVGTLAETYSEIIQSFRVSR